jgi:hypothetical protein
MTTARRSATRSSLQTRTALLFGISVLGATLASSMRAHAADLPSFAVALEGRRISPSHLDVPAMTRIKLVLRNTSGSAVEFEGREVRVEKVLGPGAESFVVLPPLERGTYRFFDEFHPDAPDLLVTAQ